MQNNSSARVKVETLKVSSIELDGWVASPDRTPSVGDFVHCVDGRAEVVGVHGRTSSGSRLLELKVDGSEGKAYFAAASNVLQKALDE
ncbi:MAG: hypothetical protein O2958_08265 [Gemmatimonadetes bacterium]|nr:hypothetical protein [Gemmatimonadota bacterium]MDA1103936.1 hypothetical protein [Gemmatimonadota bacterium]